MLLLSPAGIAPLLADTLGVIIGVWATFGHFLDQNELGQITGSVSEREETTKKWLDYWVIYSTTSMSENIFGDLILKLVPFWYVFKVGACMWIIMASVKGQDSVVNKEVQISIEEESVEKRQLRDLVCLILCCDQSGAKHV